MKWRLEEKNRFIGLPYIWIGLLIYSRCRRHPEKTGEPKSTRLAAQSLPSAQSERQSDAELYLSPGEHCTHAAESPDSARPLNPVQTKVVLCCGFEDGQRLPIQDDRLR
jgi:hypothetical protein